jgi:hypothetical protein
MKAGLMTRLALVEAALHPDDQWWKLEGLCAILEYAKRLPPRDPEALEEGEGSFAQLLREGRQAQRQQEEA